MLKIVSHSLLLAVLAISAPAPALAQNAELDEKTAAGKDIYTGVTNRLGCERCHGPDGTAKKEGVRYQAERSIQGKTAQEIRVAIMALPMMWGVKLTDEELEQVAAYLEYLQETSD